MAIPSFIFGGDTGYRSPGELARARAIAEALRSNDLPDTLGEGLYVGLKGIRSRMATAKLDRQEAAGRASAAPLSNAIAAALQGPSAYPSAPPSGGNVSFDGDMKSGISATAQALGIDPIDLATAISYETGGTFNPTQKGPTTQWGQHKGLIQFGEPQAKEYGVDWNNPVGSQLGPEGAVAKYLRATGVKPGMGMMDIYSAINAGGVGRYGASDANNGGAPGTVADKVNNQMAGHRAKALALMGGNQVASNDPQSAIMAALTRQQPPQSIPDPFLPTLQGQDVTPPQQVAQDNSRIPPMAGGPGDVAPGGGPNMGLLFKALGNEFVPEGQRAAAEYMIKQQMNANDPGNQLDAEYKRAQIKNIESEIAKRNDPNARDKFGNSVIWGQDADGNWVAMQPSSAGGLEIAKSPDGVKLSPPGVSNLNLGTEFGIRDRNGAVVNTVPIDNAGKARDTAKGEAQGAAEIAAPGDIQAAQNALDLLESIRSDPYKERGTGFSSILNNVRGTGGYDFANKVEQAKSGAFLTAIQQMRGLGSLSNAEGGAATAAVTRMNTATSEEAFNSALDDHEKIVKQGMNRARARLAGKPAPLPEEAAPAAAPSKPVEEMSDEELRAIINGG